MLVASRQVDCFALICCPCFSELQEQQQLIIELRRLCLKAPYVSPTAARRVTCLGQDLSTGYPILHPITTGPTGVVYSGNGLRSSEGLAIHQSLKPSDVQIDAEA